MGQLGHRYGRRRGRRKPLSGQGHTGKVSRTGTAPEQDNAGRVVSDSLIAPRWPAWRVHAVGLLAILLGGLYLTWRLIASRDGATQWMFWLLIGAEIFGWIGLILHAHESWKVLPSRRSPPLDLAVDVLVPTYDEGAVILEATLVGCAEIQGRATVWVLDDGRRDWVRILTESFGFNYVTRSDNKHAKAGNINAVLPKLQGDLMLVLDADHVPSPEIIVAMTGYFADPAVALVQSPHFFRNRDSAQHTSLENNEQGLFFEVLLPGREHLDAVFWCGSGALIRLDALRSIGGLSTRTITEDFETSLKLHEAGYRMRYHHEHLLQGLAPHNLASYLLQRDRWARGTIRVLFMDVSPLWARGWRLRTRAAFLSNLWYYLMPFQIMVFASLLIVTLWSGWLPVGTIPIAMIAMWAVWTAAAIFSAHGMSRGNRSPGDGEINNWVTAGPYLNAWLMLLTHRSIPFRVTPKEGVDEGGIAALRMLWLPTLMLALTTSALVARLAAQGIGVATGTWLLPEISVDVLFVVTLFALWQVATLSRALRRYTKRRQYRLLWRFPVDLTGTLAGVPARIVDLHEAGARFHVPANTGTTPVMPISIDVRDGTGQIRQAVGNLTVRSTTISADGILAVGGSCAWASTRDRREIIFETHVYAPLMMTKGLEAAIRDSEHGRTTARRLGHPI